VRRLTEGPTELPTEVGGREPRRARERRHIERLAVAGVDEILGPEEMAGRRNGGDHRRIMVRRVSEAENLFGEEHVQRYRETGGEVGHRWKRGSKILLLTTKGRKSGEPRTKPLIYEQDGDRYVVLASKGGAPAHPEWYRNLQKDSNVEVQVLDEVFPARARTAEGDERERLWKLANQQWPDYDSYQTRTDRKIPVVVLERTSD
jgi:deazaflavin-dependent oxidoreductase (nitroreductase family)